MHNTLFQIRNLLQKLSSEKRDTQQWWNQVFEQLQENRSVARGTPSKRLLLQQLTIGQREDFIWLNLPWPFYRKHAELCRVFLGQLCRELRAIGLNAHLALSGGGSDGCSGCIQVHPSPHGLQR